MHLQKVRNSKLGALTEEDRTLLRQFVESISYQ